MLQEAFHSKDLSAFRFLVSGGAGFIGSNIVEYLLKYGAREVRVLDNLSSGFVENLRAFQSLPNFTFIEGDISDYDLCLKACEGIDYVSHQAALGSVPRSLKDPIGTNKANIDGFVNMATAARLQGVQRMVFASSSSVYGDSLDLPKMENQIGRPLSPYAVSKYANELYAKVFTDNYGQELIGLRYFNVFGPRQSPQGDYAAVIPLFIQALTRGEAPIINGDGKQTRDFTFVENAVQANILALFTDNKRALGESFNVALGESFSLLQLVNYLEDIIGVQVKPIHRENREGDIRDSLADVSKAKELLSYSPEIHFKTGLQKTVDYFSTNK
ncbi:MAG: SDR family oxidoreductase [Vicingaceae bacterium]